MKKTVLGFVVVWLLPCLAPAQTILEYRVVAQKSSATFSSRAVLNSFDGKTRKIAGWAKFNPQNLSLARAHISVDLASIDTDNNLRNKHMREKFLHTNQYPAMTFDLTKISQKNSLPGDTETTVLAHGKFHLHGMTKNVEIPITILRHDHELNIQSSFPLTLSDYNIKTPSFLGMHMEETIQIKIDLVWAR